jgi:hypothetical protein
LRDLRAIWYTLLQVNTTIFFNVFYIMHFTVMFTHIYLVLFTSRIRGNNLYHVVHGTCCCHTKRRDQKPLLKTA